MKKNMLIVGALWVALVSGSFVWNYIEARKVQREIALQTAKSFFDQIVITRKWNAQHGGVYVRVTDRTQPNRYLDVPMRDIAVSRSLTLTKVNPAFMTRQLSEIAAAQQGVRFHITSLKPIRPDNRPTAQETRALEAFEKGMKEMGQFDSRAPGAAFFYMAPLTTEKACLQCHARQGYKEGDIRGGISITLPFIQEIPFMTIVLGHAVIGLAGLLGISVFGGQLAKYHDLLRQQAVIDALTGIPNRRSFSETILREFKRAHRESMPLAVIMCDIDKFKNYNDRYGHAAGDECLKNVARTIQTSLMRPADFCARYGGEEFVIILPNTKYQGALQVAERVRAQVQRMGIVNEEAGPLQIVTLSLGVAIAEDCRSVSNEDLIRHADQALYQAKEKGRNRVESFNAGT